MDIRNLLTELQAVFDLDVIRFLNQRPVNSQEEAKKLEAELKEEIKKRFHTLSKKHHPDKTQGDDTMFKRLSNVYKEATAHINIDYRPPQPVFQMQVFHFSGMGAGTASTTTFNAPGFGQWANTVYQGFGGATDAH